MKMGTPTESHVKIGLMIYGFHSGLISLRILRPNVLLSWQERMGVFRRSTRIKRDFMNPSSTGNQLFGRTRLFHLNQTDCIFFAPKNGSKSLHIWRLSASPIQPKWVSGESSTRALRIPTSGAYAKTVRAAQSYL